MGAALSGLLLPLAAAAQMSLTGVAPARHAPAAARPANVVLTFSNNVLAASINNTRAQGSQTGLRATTNTSAANTITLDPAADLRPGEVLTLTVPATVLRANSTALTPPQVIQMTGAATGGSGVFELKSTSAVGTTPTGVLLIDADGDGNLDLIACNSGGNGATYRLGNGDGTFSATATTLGAGVGSNPYDLASADLNLDGLPDVVTANTGLDNASVFLNNAGGVPGTFAARADYAAGDGPGGVALGDLNADGLPDLVLTNTTANTLTVRLNQTGTPGTFGAATTVALPAGSAPYKVALADADNDGDLDVFTAHAGTDRVNWRANDGTGTLGASTLITLPAGAAPRGLALGDVDGDGDVDLVTANTGANTVSVSRYAAGAFGTPTQLTVGSATNNPFGVALADLDGDTDLDLLIATDNALAVRRSYNDGTGTFDPDFGTTTTGSDPGALAVGDLDGDLDLDFVSANRASNNVSVRLNYPLPTVTGFAPASGTIGTSVTLTGTHFTGATAVRFGAGSGTTAAFTVNSATSITVAVPPGALTGPVSVTGPGGTGTSAATFTVNVMAVSALAPVANLRNAARTANAVVTFDRNVTNVAATQQALRAFSGQRAGLRFGTQGATGTVSGANLTLNPTVDFRPGETVQLTATTAATSVTGALRLRRGYVWQLTAAAGTGTGTYAPGSTASTGGGTSGVVLGDVDTDGDLDLVATNYDGNTVSIRLNDGNGAYSGTTNLAAGTNPWGVALLDYDGDTDLDLAVVAQGTAQVRLFANNGSGTFAADGIITADFTTPNLVQAGDMDGDGDLDLVVTDVSGTTVLLNADGAGAFVEGFSASDFEGTGLALGDVDGDGDLDVMTGATDTPYGLRLLLNDGGGSLGAPTTLVAPAGCEGLTLADLDGDNDLDAVGAFTNGTLRVHLNTGSGSFGAATVLTVSGAHLTAVRAADTDGDGDLDLLAANTNAGTVGRWLNDGAAAFAAPVSTAVGSGPYDVVAADVDGDLDLDFVTANYGAGSASVRFNLNVPTISSFTPTSGPAGTTVTVTGTGFTGATGVSLNGTPAASYTVTSATSLTFVVPAGASGAGPLAVTNPAGTGTSAGNFSVVPTITGFTPGSGPAPTSVSITGTGFTGASSVTFNGVAAASISVVSATSLTATVPAGASTGPIAVTTAGGTGTSVPNFTVPAPTITSFAPTSGPAGTSVTVTGTGLLGVTGLTLNGTAVVSFTIQSATSITFPVPPGASGAGPITATGPSGTATSATNFGVVPVVGGSFSPSSGPAGTSVSVSGLGFLGATAVTFNGVAAASFTVNSAGSITATVPVGASTGPIAVTTAGGTGTSATSFTVPASISSFTPTSGPAGTTVTVAGNALTGASAVTVNGYPVASFTVVSATSLTFVVPAAAAGGGPVRIVTPNGSPSSTGAFTITPTITSFTPTSGTAPTVVDLTGTGFGGVTAVTFNGVAATYSVNSLTSITANLPAGASTGPIRVITNNGTAISPTDFTVPPPTITSFTPTSGLPGGSAALTGTGLLGITSMTLNGTPVTAFVVTSATSITFTVPAGATGVGPITATGPSGTAISPTLFTVPYPVVTAVSPTRHAPSAPVASDVSLTFDVPMQNTAGTLGAVRVFGEQTHGRRLDGQGATATVSGNTLTLNPTADFRPGETVRVTTTPDATATNGQTLPRGHVHHFVARAGMATGVFEALPDVANLSGVANRLTTADVNNDGFLDLLVPNGNAATPRIQIRYGDGTGAFAGTTDVVTTSTPRALSPADLDGDGDLDLVVQNGAVGRVGVHLNLGGGTFGAYTEVDAGGALTATHPFGLGDVDADGDLDLVAARGGGLLAVPRNDGTGAFPSFTTFTISGGLLLIPVLTDIDNDGDLDVLAINANGTPQCYWRLNDGTGAFAGGGSVLCSGGGGTRRTLEVGDVDHDGDVDAIVGDDGNRPQLLRNDGTGTFTAEAALDPTNGAVWHVRLADVDGDQDLDLLTATGAGNAVDVRRNDGTGTFGAPTTVAATGTGTQALALGDWDNDGDLDLAAANTGTPSVSVWLNDELRVTAVSPARHAPSAPVASDVSLTFDAPLQNTAGTLGAVRVFGEQTHGRRLDGQGATASVSGNTLTLNPDVDFRPGETVRVTTTTAATATTGQSLLRGHVHHFVARAGVGPGVFQPLPDVANVGGGVGGMATADVNADGFLDLLVPNASSSTPRIQVRYGDGTGAFGGTTDVVTGAGPRMVRPADLDGDGDLDLVIHSFAANRVGVQLNQGGGAFGAFTVVNVGAAVGGFFPFAVGDVDGDGDLDLAVSRGSGVVAFARNDGAGAFPAFSTITIAGGSGPVPALADVDNDGDLDLLGLDVSNPVFYWRRNDGTGQFSGTESVALAGGAGSRLTLEAGDVDSDGDVDVVVGNTNLGNTQLLRNDGTGTFAPETSLPVAGAAYHVRLADVDGDLDLDLLTATASANAVEVRRNDGTGQFGAATVLAATGTFTGALALGDWDNDGDLDLAAANINAPTRSVSVWLNVLPPALTSFVPALGPEGTPVTLTGTFNRVTEVRFNGVPATGFVRVSETTLTTTVPVGATTGTIEVRSELGNASSSTAFVVLPIFAGTVNQCLTATPIVSTGSGEWQYLRAANGDLVAALNDQGTALGTVGLDFRLHQGAVRRDGAGREYFDRNWHLTAQNPFTGQQVRVRFYARNPEFAAFVAANDGDGNDVTALNELNITQYSGPNEDCALSNNAAPNEYRLLTPAPPQALAGANWFGLETVVPDHFSEFYLNGGPDPLPVELVRFEAQRTAARRVALTWATASERNNRGYYVERSADGRAFAVVSPLVAGHGTTQAPQQYAWADEGAPATTLYYRLMQVDEDGQTSRSDIRAVQPAAGVSVPLIVWPNPIRRGQSLSLAGADPTAPAHLYDGTGRCVLTLPAGAAVVPTAALPPGVYVLRAGGQAVRLVVE